MPVVTVRSSPNGLPIATTASPTSSFEESPRLSGFRTFLLAFTFSSATSVLASLPSSLASTLLLSPKATSILLAPSTTCAFVSTCPCSSITKPDPVA